MNSTKIPGRKALAYILLSLALVSGNTAAVVLYFKHMHNKKGRDPHFKVVAIAQRSEEGDALPTSYLAELMELSADRPVNLYRVNSRELARKLERSALIKNATVTKIKPGTLLVDYRVRTPIAYLGDFSNTALDREGVMVPFKPYFTPKKLPTIYLGLTEDEGGTWDKAVQGARAALAMEIYAVVMRHCCDEGAHLRKIDVSQAYALSYGQRQVVVWMEDRINQGEKLHVANHLLRLNTENYRQGLANYLVLRKYWREHTKVDPNQKGVVIAPMTLIDMRASHLAYIK